MSEYNLKPFYTTCSELVTNDKSIATIYGRRPSDGYLVPILVDDTGALQLSGEVVLNVSDITPVNVVQSDGSLLNATINLADIGGSPLTLGQQLMAMSLPVVIASNQSPIPVVITSSTPGTGTYFYGEQLAVAAGSTVTLVTYTVPAASTFSLTHIEASGDTVGLYVATDNASTMCKRRSSYAVYNIDFAVSSGVLFSAGDVVALVVTNEGKEAADFNGTIYGLLN